MVDHRSAAMGILGFVCLAFLSVPAASSDEPSAEQRITELSQEVENLRKLVLQLQAEMAAQRALSAPPATAATAPAQGTAPTQPDAPTSIVATAASSPGVASPSASPSAGAPAAAFQSTAGLLQGMTVNAMLDGYYEYNTNAPIGRVNYLRAYDVSSDSFSLNQADLVLESAPDPSSGKRAGARIDLQYGQATASLQGNPANEPRPEIYRSIFQAYGTYVFPLGNGLSVDFGKWASSLGLEGNYTKDQTNYSRSLWFDYLPFYHMGLRAKYPINDVLTVNAWITNGTEQTEAFKNYKDRLLGLVLTPTPRISWTVNYYEGQEHPDVTYLPASASEPAPAQGGQTLPNQQGTYILPIANAPDGKLQILDSYATWQASTAVTLSAEADYVQQRLYSYSTPLHVAGGAIYGAYQLSPTVALGARAEYLADSGGLFSGAPQYLKEGTLTIDYRPTDGFLMRGEYRRDQSNQRFFLSNTLGVLDTSQPTFTLGLVWWVGQKEGTW